RTTVKPSPRSRSSAEAGNLSATKTFMEDSPPPGTPPQQLYSTAAAQAGKAESARPGGLRLRGC
ncbi:MAG: hypothetical protein ACE1Z8_10290, partial [Candidatus Acidiferrales bacterium]